MKKFKSIVYFLLLTFLLTSSGLTALREDYVNVVQRFVNSIKKNDKKELSQFVSLPLKRRTPIPSIETKKEFIKRFDEVFDAKLINIITTSEISDWSDVGSNGIMLKDGIIWLTLAGNLLAVNYESEIETKMIDDMIKNSKKNLHSSLHSFIEPVAEFKTKKFYIRIDKLENDNYRYAVWPVEKSSKEKPDMIINNGKMGRDRGVDIYTFTNGNYHYSCKLFWDFDETYGDLEVYKKEKLLLSQPIIKRIK
ncbi:MAG: hypothetical protein HQK75_18430 [Candidatus Magnetomorum sp.]|nr:hypothetical protein [Candidatus Magnetomorum sp.]